MKEVTVCICGGGALGHVLAGVISSKGYKVNLLTNRPSKWSQSVVVEDLKGRMYEGCLNGISDDPQEVIPEANMVILCLPGYLINEMLYKIKFHLSPDTLVGSVVSSTGFFVSAISHLGDSARLFGFQRVPFIARVREYGRSAQLLGYKSSLNIAFLPEKFSARYLPIFEALFDTPVSALNHVLEATLTNSNPILHPVRLYRLFSSWKPEVVYPREFLFYEEWDDETSDLLIHCDAEFQKLLAALPSVEVKIPSLLDYYQSTDKRSLTDKIKSIDAFKSIKVPMKPAEGGYVPDFDNRYFTEDIPYGLLLIKCIAELADVNTPVMDRVLEWGQSVLNKEYVENHRISGKDIEEVSCIDKIVLQKLIGGKCPE